MTDRHRTSNQPDHNNLRQADDLTEDVRAAERERTTLDRPPVADDRGVDRDRERRSFSGDRERDPLGSEMEIERGPDENADREDEG